MPEAVIVAASRTPIGRAAQGLARRRAARRPARLRVRRRARQGARGAARGRRRRDGRLRLPRGEAGDEPGAPRRASSPACPRRRPDTTVNRFCASSLQTIRMAFHAIKAGEGDCYVAAGVESITQVSGYPKSEEELHPAAVRRGRDRRGLHPDGPDRRERGRALGRRPARTWTRFAQRSQERARRRADVRVLRARADAVPEGGRDGRRRRRRAAGELDAGEARLARARVPPRRQGHGRERVPAQRRRRGGARPLGEKARGAGREAARADHRLGRLRRRPGDHGRRPDRGDPPRARAGRA